MPQGCGEEDGCSPAERDAGGSLPRQDRCDRTSPSDRKRDKSETLTKGPLLKSKI